MALSSSESSEDPEDPPFYTSPADIPTIYTHPTTAADDTTTRSPASVRHTTTNIITQPPSQYSPNTPPANVKLKDKFERKTSLEKLTSLTSSGESSGAHTEQDNQPKSILRRSMSGGGDGPSSTDRRVSFAESTKEEVVKSRAGGDRPVKQMVSCKCCKCCKGFDVGSLCVNQALKKKNARCCRQVA